jgi:uncharacterized protein (DUF1330 family)
VARSGKSLGDTFSRPRKQVHFHPTDTTRFVVVREFDDLDQARRYLASPDRQQRMQAARVVNCVDYLPEAAAASR